MSSSQDAFLLVVFQMNTIALVSVLNKDQINRLHHFSDILYIYQGWNRIVIKQDTLSPELVYDTSDYFYIQMP